LHCYVYSADRNQIENWCGIISLSDFLYLLFLLLTLHLSLLCHVNGKWYFHSCLSSSLRTGYKTVAHLVRTKLKSRPGAQCTRCQSWTEFISPFSMQLQEEWETTEIGNDSHFLIILDSLWYIENQNKYVFTHSIDHGLRTPGEEIAFTAQPKIKSQSKMFLYGRSIFCLPHRPKISDFFDLCLHWVSVVRGIDHPAIIAKKLCLK
jgi:hypothetical protein